MDRYVQPVLVRATIETMHRSGVEQSLVTAMLPRFRLVRFDPRGVGASQRGPMDYSAAGMTIGGPDSPTTV